MLKIFFFSCIPGAFSWITLSIAQVGTPWRVGSKGVTLINILLSRIPLMCTLGAFLISLEGVIVFHHLLKTLMRHQDEDRNKKPCPWYTGVFLMYIVWFLSHAHSLHILPFSIDVRVLSLVPGGVRRKSPRVWDQCSYNIQLWCVCPCENLSYICNFVFAIWVFNIFLI